MTAELFTILHDLTGSTAELTTGPGGIIGVSVDGDVIGSGATESEALEDAIATAQGWRE